MKIFLSFLCCILFQSCRTTYDLVINNALVFDTRQGVTLGNKTILINADTIVNIVNNKKLQKGRTVIDAAGRLVTPGIIDAHIHPMHFFGDYDAAPKYLAEDSLVFFRKTFSDNYLPFGVTAVMIMGQPETWLKPILNWSVNPSPDYTDIYTVGGAIISKEDRKPYIGHSTVDAPLAARQKIIDYHKMGIRHIKLYWRLRGPEFVAAFKTADSLGMKVYGHIDNGIVSMDTALLIGLRNYEHLFTIERNVSFDETDGRNYEAWMNDFYGKMNWDSSLSFSEQVMNETRFIVEKKSAALDLLIDHLAKSNVSFSTTIHLIGERLGLTYFSNPNNKPDSGWSKKQVQRNADNFTAFMLLAKKVYDKGIKIRIGTD
ncbi:MAG: hypothetical protein ABUT20_19570, partial [Bacteroidota bacterium]